jgi:2-hydroxychromene-2-carboxylate isomerase
VRPTFYFELASPECYLAAERVNSTLPAVPVWQPVRSPPGTAVEGASAGSRAPTSSEQADLERRARAQGLPPLRFPYPWPHEVDAALRAAAFAQASGRVVAFSLAALRQAFAAGRDLSVVDNVLIAAAACELHPRAVLKGIESRSTEERLQRATEEAAARGVVGVPAVFAGGHLFEGPSAVEEAAAVLGTG